ncbi:MAG: alpha/beta hydrolase [Ardenticatenaceae bacterium]|nr:alpha/beta hydrolase [Ardenticatenaceae bacterium]
MRLRTITLGTTGALAAAGIVLGAQVYRRYQRDLAEARRRLEALGSRVVETECGHVEYVERAEGYPVLVVHGIVGGFDAGIASVGATLGEGYRLIIPSRFGYLRTPLPQNASPATQADAHAALLDSLGVERAAVIAYSAGATSAIRFALRDPDRISALVLVVPNAPSAGRPGLTLPPKPVLNALYRSDFIFWLATTRFRSALYGTMGVPKEFDLTPTHEAEIAALMQTVFPVRPRADGAMFDAFVSNPDINSGYPFGAIAVPVLVVSARDDALAGYENARFLAEQIPGAQLLTFENGGHMLLGQSERVGRGIQEFLREYVRAGR